MWWRSGELHGIEKTKNNKGYKNMERNGELNPHSELQKSRLLQQIYGDKKLG